eukprot:9080792-Pyramimonas_sp.AAC.1
MGAPTAWTCHACCALMLSDPPPPQPLAVAEAIRPGREGPDNRKNLGRVPEMLDQPIGFHSVANA